MQRGGVGVYRNSGWGGVGCGVTRRRSNLSVPPFATFITFCPLSSPLLSSLRFALGMNSRVGNCDASLWDGGSGRVGESKASEPALTLTMADDAAGANPESRHTRRKVGRYRGATCRGLEEVSEKSAVDDGLL